MAEIKIAGIMRAGVFSPNHIGNDAAIFNVVAEQLRKRGCEVKVYSEDQFAAGAVNERIILNMCRERRSIELLQTLEDEGRLVINSGYGIENCTRERMSRILMASGIPYPESFIVDTDEVVKDRLVRSGFSSFWVKRGDEHSRHREDVTYARHAQEHRRQSCRRHGREDLRRLLCNRRRRLDHDHRLQRLAIVRSVPTGGRPCHSPNGNQRNQKAQQLI